jgi:hypothetical protein
MADLRDTEYNENTVFSNDGNEFTIAYDIKP